MSVSSERMPLTLAAYRMLTAAGTTLAPHLLEHRLRRGKENPDRLAERRGEPSAPRPTVILSILERPSRASRTR